MRSISPVFAAARLIIYIRRHGYQIFSTRCYRNFYLQPLSLLFYLVVCQLSTWFRIFYPYGDVQCLKNNFNSIIGMINILALILFVCGFDWEVHNSCHRTNLYGRAFPRNLTSVIGFFYCLLLVARFYLFHKKLFVDLWLISAPDILSFRY